MMLLPELPLRIELCLFPALLLEEVVEPPSLSLLLVSLLSSFSSLEGSLYKLTVPLWTTKIRAADPFMSPILVISFPVTDGHFRRRAMFVCANQESGMRVESGAGKLEVSVES
jgi:hypothetical protein